MEIQLNELIDRIKKDGVEDAEKKAAEILENAEKQAKQIVDEANRKAQEILLEAKEQNERSVRVSEDAIRQAARNTLISFRESVARELDAIVGQNVNGVYSSEETAELIVKVVEAWSKQHSAESIEVVLSQADAQKLEQNLLLALKEKMLSGVTLRPNDNLDAGFRIAVDNGKAYYDYSAEALTNMLSAYLNPRVTSLMKEAENL